MTKKYEIIQDSKINFFGRTLFRIKATKTFGHVKEGDLGGYIESEKNLTQISGDAWIGGNARIGGNAWIRGNARIWGDEKIDCKITSLTTEIWTITFGNQIMIGCQRHTLEEWQNFSDKEINDMHSEALNWWKKWKEVVLKIGSFALIDKQ